MSTWIQTWSGRRVNLEAPRAGDIEPDDIAHALANLCRFTGHAKRFYSVAEHSLAVAEHCRRAAIGHGFEPRGVQDTAFAGLLHDAHEAYLGDIATPLKNALGPELDRLARGFDFAIAERFALAYPWPDLVKTIDRRILADERAQALGPGPKWRGIGPPLGARLRFLPAEIAKHAYRIELGRYVRWSSDPFGLHKALET